MNTVNFTQEFAGGHLVVEYCETGGKLDIMKMKWSNTDYLFKSEWHQSVESDGDLKTLTEKTYHALIKEIDNKIKSMERKRSNEERVIECIDSLNEAQIARRIEHLEELEE